MTDINKIVENVNLPKQLIDKSEKLLKTLFGPSLTEFGEMIADNVKFRRFKNQIKIFTKAQNILKQKNINPTKVSLKALAPLIEYSSYEEDKTLQEKWVNLTVNILSNNIEESLQQNFIRILNLISAEEASILDKLYVILKNKQEQSLKTNLRQKKKRQMLRKKGLEFREANKWFAVNEAKFLDSHIFSMSEISTKLKINKEALRLYISNLIALGVLKWKIKIDISSKMVDDDTVIEIEHQHIEIYDYSTFIFTHIGARLVQVCRG